MGRTIPNRWAGKRIRLNPRYSCIEVSDDELHFRVGPFSDSIYRISDSDRTGNLSSLASVIKEGDSVERLTARFDDRDLDQVWQILDTLHEKTIVRKFDEETTLPDGFGFVNDDDAIERCEELDVTIIGDTEMGRMIRSDLESAGVSVLMFTSAEISDLEAVVSESDFVVGTSASANDETLYSINECAVSSETPWLSVQLRGLDGFVGPTVVPGETACYNCFKERMLANIVDASAYRKHERSGDAPAHELHPSLSRTLAGHASMDILNQIANGPTMTVGRVLYYDFEYVSMESNDVLRLPRCQVCERGVETLGHQEHATMERLIRSTREHE